MFYCGYNKVEDLKTCAGTFRTKPTQPLWSTSSVTRLGHFWKLLLTFWTIWSTLKTALATFSATFGNFWQLFITTSGHTVYICVFVYAFHHVAPFAYMINFLKWFSSNISRSILDEFKSSQILFNLYLSLSLCKMGSQISCLNDREKIFEIYFLFTHDWIREMACTQSQEVEGMLDAIPNSFVARTRLNSKRSN